MNPAPERATWVRRGKLQDRCDMDAFEQSGCQRNDEKRDDAAGPPPTPPMPEARPQGQGQQTDRYAKRGKPDQLRHTVGYVGTEETA